jgi:hypothetical protein
LNPGGAIRFAREQLAFFTARSQNTFTFARLQTFLVRLMPLFVCRVSLLVLRAHIHLVFTNVGNISSDEAAATCTASQRYHGRSSSSIIYFLPRILFFAHIDLQCLWAVSLFHLTPGRVAHFVYEFVTTDHLECMKFKPPFLVLQHIKITICYCSFVNVFIVARFLD